MASNRFGLFLTLSTFGESHGKGIGALLDGVPPNISFSEEDIFLALKKRQGGALFTTPRKEEDIPTILSGVFEGKTTGAPLAIWVENQNKESSIYEKNKDLKRPGHANTTYLEKYGHFDYRGGGRASARETVARVAAGALADKILVSLGISVEAYLQSVGNVSCPILKTGTSFIKKNKEESSLFCPFKEVEKEMEKELLQILQEKDSLGGIVSCLVEGLPPGLGEPLYEKLEARLSFAMMGLPASKGFEIGEGFQSASLKGSQMVDIFHEKNSNQTKTNHSGGVLAGISTGMPLFFRVAFKPPSSIPKSLDTTTFSGEKTAFEWEGKGRHDPCVAIRAVPIVEAMTKLVLADFYLMQKVLT